MTISRSKMREMLNTSREKLVQDVVDILMAANVAERDPEIMGVIDDTFDGSSLWVDILEAWDENYEGLKGAGA